MLKFDKFCISRKFLKFVSLKIISLQELKYWCQFIFSFSVFTEIPSGSFTNQKNCVAVNAKIKKIKNPYW